MSFSGAVLIIVIAAIRAVTINKLPKKTFIILWGIVLFRLLIPYTVPSVFSVYTLLSPTTPVDIKTENTGTYAQTPINTILPPVEAPTYEQTGESPQLLIDHASPVSTGLIIWLAGMTLCAAFFTISYLHWRLEFQTSLPVQNNYVNQWLETHLRKRPVSVRQSDKILTPLTYGIFRPVILMPKKTNWENTEQLEYVLLHEYVHICRYDSAVKLISALAVCVHWFNPLVWVMYVLFQRDIELACDESVVHRFGETSKSTYAHMLIDMEARKSGFMPLCNSFSKNAIEERIIAIMKIKKTSVIAILVAVILIAGVTTAFATTAADKKAEIKKTENNNTNFSDEEVSQLLALQFDGYEDMSVSEYQKKVWEMTDTKEYLDLLERFSQDTALYEKKDSDEVANFLFYTLEPLTAEKWQTREFGGACRTNYTGASDNASLEYWITLAIQNADTLTVGEYNNTRICIMNELNAMLQDKTAEQLQTEAVMQKMLHAEKEVLKTQWSSEKLKVDVDYVYTPLYEYTTQNSVKQEAQQEQEKREYPNGTKEDYRSLLTLKTPDYQKMSVADFNMALLDWANEDHERMERINIDTAYHDFSVDLTSDELAFVTVSVMFSGMENGAYVRSNYTGKPEVDPSYGQYLPEKSKQQNGQSAWCDLYYQFSYHIADKKAIIVEDRDNCISGMMTEIQDFWNAAALEDLLNMTKEDITKALDEIAIQYSNDKITIAISEDQISFECMDELNIEREGYKASVIDIGALNIGDGASEDGKVLKIGVINTDALKIRGEASEDAEICSLLMETQAVVILSEKNGFYHVIVPNDEGDIEGWVKKEYVDVNGWVGEEYVNID
ncbi:MAG: hypothetical protein K2N89_02580 [Lachnospiraceae bacterium]|nr:hypothetical protein [Lachnospiraceae bacterium]